jgi:hypothetical protein
MIQFFGGTLDPTWPHAVLIAGTIVGGVLVGIGVILEAPKIFSVPVAAVFVGIVIEAACTLLLFGFDEGISNAQQSKIIALETKLAPRTLSEADAAEVAFLLKQFKGQEFTIGSYGGEAALLADRLKVILEKADWKWFIPEYQILPLAGATGIQIWARSQDSREAARALIKALGDKFIEAALFPNQPDDPSNRKIEIIVGSKF